MEDPWADTERPRQVRVDGSPRAAYHRVARFAKAAFLFDKVGTAVLLGFAAGSVVFPLPGALLATLLCGAVYADLGIRRASALLAFPSFLLAPFVLAVGVLAPTFRWGGREYAWRDAIDVVVDP